MGAHVEDRWSLDVFFLLFFTLILRHGLSEVGTYCFSLLDLPVSASPCQVLGLPTSTFYT